MKKTFLLLIITLSINSVLAKASELDSDELDAAFKALSVKQEKDLNYESCREMAGQYAYKYDYINHVWELRYSDLVGVSETIIHDAPSSKKAAIEKQLTTRKQETITARQHSGEKEKGEYCSHYFSGLVDGSIGGLEDIESRLSPRLGSTTDINILNRNKGLEIGCIKEGFNRDNPNFDTVKSSCRCLTGLMVDKMSNNDIDRYLSLASSNRPHEALQIIANKISDSEIQSCTTR